MPGAAHPCALTIAQCEQIVRNGLRVSDCEPAVRTATGKLIGAYPYVWDLCLRTMFLC